MMIYLKLLLATLFWGGAFVAGRSLSQNIGHFSISFLRFAIASALLLPLVFMVEGKFPRLKRPEVIRIVLLGLTGIFAYNAMFFKGLQTVEVGRASLIIATCPVFITISSAAFFKEKINLLKAVGIVISVCGAVVVISRGEPIEILRGSLGFGEFYLFCCVLSWVVFCLMGKAVMKELSPLVAVSYSTVVGTAALALPALREGLIANIGHHSVTEWMSIAYLGVFATVIAFVWYYQAISRIGPVKSGLFINFVPIFAVLLAFLILREEITVSLAVGAVLVISGVYLTNRTSGGRTT